MLIQRPMAVALKGAATGNPLISARGVPKRIGLELYLDTGVALIAFQEPGCSLACHRNIGHFLHGVQTLRPLVCTALPHWDLAVVLWAPMKAPFELLKRSTIKDLTLKAVFLVAITMARQVSELQVLSCLDLFLLFSEEGVTLCLVSSFLPKLISPFHVNQFISLPSFWREPCQGSERYLQHLDVCRVVLQYNLPVRPFVLFAGPHKGQAASNASLDRWIWEAISLAYLLKGMVMPEALKAHSMWAQAAPLDICQAAMWSSLSTFVERY